MTIGNKIYWVARLVAEGPFLINKPGDRLSVREGRVISFNDEVVSVLYYSLGFPGGGACVHFFPQDQVFTKREEAEKKLKEGLVSNELSI